MSVGRFVPPLEFGAVRYHLGGVLKLFAVALAPCVVVALIVADFVQAALFTGIAAAVWGLGWLWRRGDARALRLREAFVVTTLAYLLFAVSGAAAFLTVAGPVDAFFEAMSGFTTTGLTVMDPAGLPPSLLFFRAFSQWIGGAGIIILSLVVLTGHGSAAARLYLSEFGQQNLLGSVVATARAVATVYVALTAAGYVALLVAGAGAFDGLLHALALLSTGGFSPFTDSVSAYGSASIAGVTVAFMLVGATSFPLLYVLLRRGEWRSLLFDVQLRMLFALIVVAVVAHVGFLGWRPELASAGLFHVVSAATTTGFVMTDPAELPEGSKMLTIGLMVIGGGVGSTAGGIKLLRWAIAVRVTWWTVLRMLLPREATVPLKIGALTITQDELRHALALFLCYVMVLWVSALLFMGMGVPALDALFEAASALGTVGQSVGVTSADLPTWSKLVLCFNMWVGRVEILPVLAMLYPRNWQRRQGR